MKLRAASVPKLTVVASRCRKASWPMTYSASAPAPVATVSPGRTSVPQGH
jgi:hypothetical protein